MFFVSVSFTFCILILISSSCFMHIDLNALESLQIFSSEDHPNRQNAVKQNGQSIFSKFENEYSSYCSSLRFTKYMSFIGWKKAS